MNLKKSQTGLSLIEIQVALVIGLILVAGAAQLFISNQTTYRTENALAELQQTGRFLVEKMTKDIRLAGYSGCSTRSVDNPPQLSTRPTTAPLPLTIPSTGNSLPAIAMVDGSNIASAIPSYPNITHPLFNPIANTDLITIQRGHQCGAGVVNVASSGTGIIPIHAPNNCGIEQDTPILITDCNEAEIVQNSIALTDAAPENIVAYDNLSQTYGRFDQPAAFVYRFISDTYYIAPSQSDPAIPSLWKITWTPDSGGTLGPEDFQATEFAQNVADLQILYGEDIDNNEVPDLYRTADQVVDENNVLTVQISLLLQSDDAFVATQAQPFQFNGQNVNTTNDRRLRAIYSTTIAIKNRLPVAIN